MCQAIKLIALPVKFLLKMYHLTKNGFAAFCGLFQENNKCVCRYCLFATPRMLAFGATSTKRFARESIALAISQGLSSRNGISFSFVPLKA